MIDVRDFVMMLEDIYESTGIDPLEYKTMKEYLVELARHIAHGVIDDYLSLYRRYGVANKSLYKIEIGGREK